MSNLEEIREKEFPQFKEITYFDYAGAMPTCSSQISAFRDLTMIGASNPHSQGQVSQTVSDMEELRYVLTDLMKTDLTEYEVCFTQNATQAIQQWGNLMPWGENSHLHYLVDNHNSVLGIRALALKRKSTVSCERELPKKTEKELNVFIFPMQSNFSGKKYPMQWVKEYQDQGGFVFLDAAAATAPDLSVYKPDFVSLSLLKLSGAHGGALLVRRDRIAMLGDPLPAGGTVLFSCARSGIYKLLPKLHQRIEAGTQNYIDIGLALAGLRVRKQIGTEDEIKERLHKLGTRFYHELAALKHSNGMDVVHFAPEHTDDFGATFSFNLFDPDGNLIGHNDVQYCFSIMDIVARFGGHCNPGSGFPALGWQEDDIERIAEENEKAGRCISNLCELQGRPVGTIRISFGSPTNDADVDKLLAVIKRHFVDNGPCPPVGNVIAPMTITRMFIFPIQNASGFEVKKWKLTPTGLLYDRCFMVVDSEGVQVRTTSDKAFALLHPCIENDELVIKIRGEEFRVNANEFEEDQNAPEQVKKFGRVYAGEVNKFLSRHLLRCVYLVRADQSKIGKMAFSSVTEESLAFVDKDFDIWRWRINVLLKGAPAFSEEGKLTGKLQIAGIPITAWRWRVICMTSSVDTTTGLVEKKALRKLLDLRSRNGALTFGTLFATNTNGETKEVSVGDQITYV